MKIVKIVLLLILILILLVYAFLMNRVGTDSLEVSFKLQENLKIIVCNPTYRLAIIQGAITRGDLIYSHEASILYKTDTGQEIMLLGPLRDLPPSYGFVAEQKILMPKQCVNGLINVRVLLKDKTAKSFQFHLRLYEDYLSSPVDPAPYSADDTLFKSQWFDLEE